MSERVSGRASTVLTARVLEEYGPVCWLQLPGCTRRATTKDHVVPLDHGGTDTLDNLRPACHSCNSKRQNLAISGVGGINVTVIVGPPAAGKSSWVREHARPTDIVIDLDRLAAALMPGDSLDVHDYPQHIRNVAISARKSAISRALRTNARCGVWLIHAVPQRAELQQYARLRYRIVTLDPGRVEVEARVARLRPLDSQQGVARWYARYPDGAATVALVTAHRPIASVSRDDATSPPAEPSRAW
ncbi:MAG: HNH endonuclease [Microthrixaceae bacterium]